MSKQNNATLSWIISLAIVTVMLVTQSDVLGQESQQESKQDRDQRMQWWRDARFGLFIHWGLYSNPAGEWKGKKVPGPGEWIFERGKLQVEDYEPLKDQFNPIQFDADQWVKIAKDAGMKYIVITTKHHDGFALYDSKVSDYDVMATPFKRDIMKELSDACRRHGLKICWYHSTMDWHHTDYLPRREWENRSSDGADYERYVRYLHAQVTELLTNYGPIGVMWFDGEWEKTWTHEHGIALDDLCRRLQPNILVNNRVDKGRQGMQGFTREGQSPGDFFRGDFGTPEQEIPAVGLSGVDWESCMTMNTSWGYMARDHDWKSKEDLIRKLVDIASKGGNFLLNVGPTGVGEIPQPSVERLSAIGQWMRVNGESIYETQASPVKAPAWGRITQKTMGPETTRLYLHLFDWPKDGQVTLKGLDNDPTNAFLLADPNRASLQVASSEQGIVVRVPTEAPDPIASVIVCDITGEPKAK